MTKLFDLTGKKAVVVGGAGGLGQAIAEGFCEAGAQVMISSRKTEALERARGELKASCGADVLVHAGDASREEDVEALLNAAEGLCRACALEMFRYGRQLAPEREK